MLDLRPLGIREVPMVGRYNYARAQRGLAPHAHPDTLEICYLAKGTQLYRVGERDYVMRGGDIFLTRPGEVHSTGEAPQEKGVLYWVQFFIPTRPDRFLAGTGADARQLVAALRDIPHRHFEGEPGMARWLDDILRLAQADAHPLQCVTLRARLTEFVLRVIRCSHRKPSPSVSPGINALLREIEARVEEPLTVAGLADRAGLSVSRFKARFKEEVGIPPADYIQRSKIAASKKLLAEQRLTVTAIAHRLGFSTSQYFATVFKRYTGHSPVGWKRTVG
jgi:AraC-like DNA-binding protein